MNDWTEGYVANINYTFGYYVELSPQRVKLAFLNAGLKFPVVGSACELGFGQGLSANIHAAASVVRWVGTDFNPAQASFAQELAAASDCGARLFDQSFAEFAQRTDLPDFDYIGLHGIWSWISNDNREVIVDFIRRQLKVGGVLYISYNTMPGWTSFSPVRQLMTRHTQSRGSVEAGIARQITDALEFAEKLLTSSPKFLNANPLALAQLKSVKEQNRQYLAHEYFNRDWLPMDFSTMAEWLVPAKVTFACSATYLDHVNELNLDSHQLAFLRSIADPIFRETVRDFLVNQGFRRDYWVKGARKFSALEKDEVLRSQRVILTSFRADIALKVNGALGVCDLDDRFYCPILNELADHRVKTLGQLELIFKEKGVSLSQIVQVVTVLAGAGHLCSVQDEGDIQQAKESTARLNSQLIRNARINSETTHLASPVTGGGVAVSRFHQLFLMAIGQGLKQPQQWAQFVWDILRQEGQRILKDGLVLENPEDMLIELKARAEEFSLKQLSILEALHIIEP
jgi:SAM-dependent methyltransferase